MRRWLIILLTVVMIFLTAPALSAQKVEQKKTPATAVPKYDPAAEQTFKGTVVEVRDRQCAMSGGLGTHAILRMADGKTIEVHMATAAWVKSYDLTLKPGDPIEVRGVQVNFEDKETIFAREVTRGNDVFEFRDKNGVPVW